MAEGTLRASVTAAPYGPVIVLMGEADMTSVQELSRLLAGQLDGGTRQLTLEVLS